MNERTQERLHNRLAAFPRAELAHLPTPLEPAPNLTRALGGPDIWIKRDDCTGLAVGGNKTRKLEFLIGDAIKKESHGVVTFGALQSNHARQTAAAAAKFGLSCDLVLLEETDAREAAWHESGNRLLDEILGAQVHVVKTESEAKQKALELLKKATERRRNLYVIPVGGSNPIGELGYVGCALELQKQIQSNALHVSCLFHATSSMGTQSGLSVGFEALDAEMKINGLSVDHRLSSKEKTKSLSEHRQHLSAELGIASNPEFPTFIDNRQLGKGYGVTTEAALEAITLTARYEGILLDPVYTGKAMAGLISAIRMGEVPRRQPIVFLHTGGSPGLFAYPSTLKEGLHRF